MAFGGAGGPVFPTQEEQEWIDDAESRVRENEWSRHCDDQEISGLSWPGLATAVAIIAGCVVTIYAIGAAFLW